MANTSAPTVQTVAVPAENERVRGLLVACAFAAMVVGALGQIILPARGSGFLAWLDTDFAALLSETALWTLFAIGLVALASFSWRDIRASLHDPRTAWLPPRRRWLITLLGPGMMLAAE